MSPHSIDLVEMFERIDFHIAYAIRKHQVLEREVEDLRQDLIVAIFVRGQKFDPALSAWATFLNNVIELELRQFRLKKRWRKHQAFEDIDEIEEEDHPMTNFYPTYELNEIERHAFFGEIQTVIDALPENLQQICRLLRFHSKAETAERLRMLTGTLARQIKKIRLLLEESKIIQDFFENFI